MSRSVRDNPIDTVYPPQPGFTIAEAEQRIAKSRAAVTVDNAAVPVGVIDIAKLQELAPSAVSL